MPNLNNGSFPATTKWKKLNSFQSDAETRLKPLARRGLERLDLLLLVVESLDLNGGEAMLWASKELGLDSYFPNRVELWKRRCHNPLRRVTQRGQLKVSDSQAMISLLCFMAERLYPVIHQLLSSREPEKINQQRWILLDQRLKELIEERMNSRRGAVQRLLQPIEQTQSTLRQLIFTLALSAGCGGPSRLRASLCDPTP